MIIGAFMNKKKGFTLIELLVVIAIIALLLAILMPALNKVKQVARDVVCRSNLKQWSLIWSIYLAENNSKLPEITTKWTRGSWITALRGKWQTDGGITKCPTAPIFKDFGNTSKHGSYTTTFRMGKEEGDDIQEYCSYGGNSWMYSGRSNNRYWGTTNVRGAGNVPFFMDSMWRGGYVGYSGTNDGGMNMPNDADNSDTNNWTGWPNGGIRNFAMPRHGSGARAGTNVLFMDMSARHVMIKEMWSLKWHTDFDTNAWTGLRATIWPGDWMVKYTEDF
jgi:prepilin-type N-terminal cleavage/methylation domain-containing protein